MTSDGPVAIIGGGFSGTMVAAQLARRGIASVLIEGNGRMGRGIAYSTREPAHVLNVRAEVMSAWPEDLEDFAREIEAEGGTAKDFVERRRFGRYLDAHPGAGGQRGAGRRRSRRWRSARRATRDGWTIGLDGRPHRPGQGAGAGDRQPGAGADGGRARAFRRRASSTIPGARKRGRPTSGWRGATGTCCCSAPG